MTKSYVDESAIDTELYLGVDSNFRRVIDQEKNKIIHLTLTADLESRGQADSYLTSLIFGFMQWYTYILDLGVDFHILEASNLIAAERFHLISTDDIHCVTFMHN